MEQDKNHNIRFPENISSVISELMDKYGIGETPKEILAKLKIGEKTTSRKVANLIREFTQGKIAIENLSSELEKRLTLSKVKAMKLAKDIQEHVQSPEEKTSSEYISPPEEKDIKKRGQDTYREPIE